MLYSKVLNIVQVSCRGPAPAGSRGTLKRNGVSEENDLEREIKNVSDKKMEERKKHRQTRGDQACSVSEAHNFIFKRDFYTLTCT